MKTRCLQVRDKEEEAMGEDRGLFKIIDSSERCVWKSHKWRRKRQSVYLHSQVNYVFFNSRRKSQNFSEITNTNKKKLTQAWASKFTLTREIAEKKKQKYGEETTKKINKNTKSCVAAGFELRSNHSTTTNVTGNKN